MRGVYLAALGHGPTDAVKANKSHACSHCTKTIRKGAYYLRTQHERNGHTRHYETYAWHPKCAHERIEQAAERQSSLVDTLVKNRRSV